MKHNKQENLDLEPDNTPSELNGDSHHRAESLQKDESSDKPEGRASSMINATDTENSVKNKVEDVLVEPVKNGKKKLSKEKKKKKKKIKVGTSRLCGGCLTDFLKKSKNRN